MSRPWRKPRIEPDEIKFTEFSGVVNTRSRKDIGMASLVRADNVVISDSKKIVRRPGFTRYLAGTFTTIFGLGDSLYVVEGGTLKQVVSPTDVRTLIGGLTGTNYSWDEINGDAYFVNGVEAGIVRGASYRDWRVARPTITSVVVADVGTLPATPLNVGQSYATVLWRFVATYELDDGRESAPSDVFELRAPAATALFTVTCPALYARTNIYVTEPDGTVYRLGARAGGSVSSIAPRRVSGRELTTLKYESMPAGIELIQFANSRAYGAQYDATLDLSVIWMSAPLGFHLWNVADEYYAMPGRVSLLLRTNAGLLIGSTKAIGHIGADDIYVELANYGVVPGRAGDVDQTNVAYFWTQRGICKAMPFENLTEADVSMPPGLSASTKMVYTQGMEQFITVTRGGGTAFNKRTERT